MDTGSSSPGKLPSKCEASIERRNFDGGSRKDARERKKRILRLASAEAPEKHCSICSMRAPGRCGTLAAFNPMYSQRRAGKIEIGVNYQHIDVSFCGVCVVH